VYVILCDGKPPTMIVRHGLEFWEAYEVDDPGTAPTVKCNAQRRDFIIQSVRSHQKAAG
jgi:hypothetical protein